MLRIFRLSSAFQSSYVVLPSFLVVSTRHIFLYSSDCCPVPSLLHSRSQRGSAEEALGFRMEGGLGSLVAIEPNFSI